MQNEINSVNRVAVKASTVCKGFGAGETRTEVLKEVNFEARLGELLLLVGPSGCGKTTLLSVIAGTLTVDRGEVVAFNAPLHTMDKKAVTRFRAENIGFIFQQYNLIPTLNCIENVSIPLRIQGATAAVAEKRAAEVLEQVGLGTRMHHRPNMLSGGQQQRVAIARALMHDPKLIHLRRADGGAGQRERREGDGDFEERGREARPLRDHRHARQPHFQIRRPDGDNGGRSDQPDANAGKP